MILLLISEEGSSQVSSIVSTSESVLMMMPCKLGGASGGPGIIMDNYSQTLLYRPLSALHSKRHEPTCMGMKPTNT